MVKAANGQGSLRYNRERKRWEMRVTIDGTRRKVTGKTQAEARERAEALRRNSQIGDGLPPEVTVSRFLAEWIDEVLPHADVSPVTIDGYTRIVRLYIVPTIGKVRLDQLTPAHVRKMLAKLRAQNLSPNTLRQARSVLRRALRTAEADALVTRNVAAIVDGVKVGRPNGRTLTPDQARALLSEAPSREYGALLTVLLATGLRKGEALALTWPALDLDSTPATLTVSQSLKIAADHSTYIDDPKTSGSRRRIHLPAPVVEVLRTHRARQAAERLEFGAGWGGKWATFDLVFTSSIGTPLDPHRVAREIKSMTSDVLGEAWTPHEMRHTAASILLAQNVPLKTVSEMLGHSSIRVTADVYGHLLEPAKTEAADAMTEALWA
jgi:integrase